MKRIRKAQTRPRKPGELATLSVAIRSFCLECYCNQVEGVTYCTDPECWCYPYRLDCTTRAKLGRQEVYIEKEEGAFVAAEPETPLPPAMGKYVPNCFLKGAIVPEGKVRIERSLMTPRRRREPGEILARTETIRAFCLECHGWEESETKTCTEANCWFYPHRLGHLDHASIGKIDQKIVGA